MILDSFVKLLVAIVLVFIGFEVYGAVIGILFGSLFSFFISFIPLKKILEEKEVKTAFPEIYAYSYPILFVLFAILLMQSGDVILARRFFSPEISGQYAVANLIGKMIFFGTLAISKTMLPLSSEKFEDGKKTSKIFYRSLIMVSLICAASLLALLIFPELIVKTLFGEEYIDVSNIALNIGIAFSFISLANLILIYVISINKKIRISYMVSFVLIQIILLIIFGKNLKQFSYVMIVSSLILFLGSLLMLKRKN